MDNQHCIKNSCPISPLVALRCLSLGEVYKMWQTHGTPVVKILDIHSSQEGCFSHCGMVEDCTRDRFTHYILVQGTKETPVGEYGVEKIWVYHVTRGKVEWIFVRDERFPSPWMRAFVRSS